MEVIVIILTSILGLASPVGLVLDSVAEDAIRAQLESVEQLEVRVDNAPNFQVLNGRLDRIRIAAKGVVPIPDARIAAVALEAENIDLDIQKLQSGDLVLDEPMRAGLQIEIRADDINHFLRSEDMKSFLTSLNFDFFSSPGRVSQRYQLKDPEVIFPGQDRLRLHVTLVDQVLREELQIEGETGLAVFNGHQLQLLEPRLLIDGAPAPDELLAPLIEGINAQLSLRQLEPYGMTLRVLQFDIDEQAIDLGLFIRLDKTFRLPGNGR